MNARQYRTYTEEFKLEALEGGEARRTTSPSWPDLILKVHEGEGESRTVRPSEMGEGSVAIDTNEEQFSSICETQ